MGERNVFVKEIMLDKDTASGKEYILVNEETRL